MKIAVVTDSNSGITQKEAEQLGIYVLAMPFIIDGTEYFEDISLSQEQFYEKLQGECNISTSQPAPGDVCDLWDRLLKEYDEIVHIPMSSGLSNSTQTARLLAQDYDGKVQVVDNQRISVTQKRSVEDALELIKRGRNAAEIREYLEKSKMESSIYIMLDTLNYLKKGGRITPAAAAIGTLLRLKPVLQIQGEKLDAFSKARTIKQAKTVMIQAIHKDMLERFGDPTGENTHIDLAHTQNFENAGEFAQETQAAFPACTIGFIDPLSLSVSCHIGPGALAVAITKKLDPKA